MHNAPVIKPVDKRVPHTNALLTISGLIIFMITCGVCKDRSPPREGERAVARAKDGFGPYMSILAIDDGELIPGKACTGFWGYILSYKRGFYTKNGQLYSTKKFKKVGGIVTRVKPPDSESFGGKNKYHCGIVRHWDGNFHCGKIKDGVCTYPWFFSERKSKSFWYIKVTKIDGKPLSLNPHPNSEYFGLRDEVPLVDYNN